jgi:serine/threonine-protein kinase
VVDTSALEQGTIVAGRYRVARKIGHGGMGAVYEVTHIHTDERLALKVLHPQVLRDGAAVERFRREARAPARITSEHVARVTDADTASDLDGAPFYVMELLVGRDLERIVADDGPLAPPVVVEYLRQVARALDKAHAIGVVHRDLKPENLFLTHREDGSPCIKLLDFGIARLAEPEAAHALQTQHGYVFGTPNYMAPEQAIGETADIGPATDVWALGLVAFKLLVGVEFFTGKTAAHLSAQIVAEPLATPSARGAPFGPGFDAWFARAVCRSTSERFGSAGEAVRELANVFGVRSSERPSAEFPRGSQPSHVALAAAPPKAPRGPALAAAGGALLLLIGGALFFALRTRSAAEAQGLVAVPTAETAPSARLPDVTPPPSGSVAEATAASTPSSVPAVTHAHADSKARLPAPSASHEAAPLSREKKKRLEALERLCSQGTYKADECQVKRQAILHGGG